MQKINKSINDDENTNISLGYELGRTPTVLYIIRGETGTANLLIIAVIATVISETPPFAIQSENFMMKVDEKT